MAGEQRRARVAAALAKRAAKSAPPDISNQASVEGTQMFDMPKNLPKGVKHQISKAELAHARAIGEGRAAARQVQRERRDAAAKRSQFDPRQWPLQHQLALLIATVIGMVLALGWGGTNWRHVSRCMDYWGYNCHWTIFSVVWWGLLGISVGGGVIYIVRLMQSAEQAAKSPQNDLFFQSGKGAIEYIRAYKRTEWTKGSLVVGLLGKPVFENGILSSEILIPKGGEFISLPTFTHIRAVSSPNSDEVSLNNHSNILDIDLRFGDLVSVLLYEKNSQLQEIYPETDGWVAFVVAKNSLTYSPRAGGWILEKRYII